MIANRRMIRLEALSTVRLRGTFPGTMTMMTIVVNRVAILVVDREAHPHFPEQPSQPVQAVKL